MAIPDLPPMTDYEDLRARFRFEIPERYNFGFDLIDERAERRDKVAFLAVDASGAQVVPWRFSDLSRSSNRVANAWREIGLERGDMAFVMIPRIPAWYEVMVGSCKAGVVAMPGTNLLTTRDIEYRINASGARAAIVAEENVEKVEAARGRCPSLERLVAIRRPGSDAGPLPPGWIDYAEVLGAASPELDRARFPATRSEELMLIYFTSGTTSLPKMVPRDHGYALAHAITGRYWMDLREEDIHWTLSDTGWAKAAWGMLYAPWQMGAAMVLFDGSGFDVDQHLRMIGALGVTTFCAPPTVYRMFAQTDLGRYDLSSIRHSMGAGEPLNPEVIRIWQEATGGIIHDGYGQTETINIVANFPCLPVKPGAMGRPVPGFDVDTVDDEGARCPEGTIGHIAVRLTDPWPPGLFRGYWKAPEANEKIFRNGWYYTGDTAWRDEDGYLWFVGRADDIISSAGYRISPFEVESTLLEHPAVAESAVVGKPDPLRGEIVKAYVVLAAGYTPGEALAGELQEFVKTQTAPYKYPREIEFRESLPKTISGKIRRVELREETSGSSAPGGKPSS